MTNKKQDEEQPERVDAVTLKDGRVVEFDLYQITQKEYVEWFSKDSTPEYEQELIAKVTGLSVDELDNMPRPDYHKVAMRLIALVKNPLLLPN